MQWLTVKPWRSLEREKLPFKHFRILAGWGKFLTWIDICFRSLSIWKTNRRLKLSFNAECFEYKQFSLFMGPFSVTEFLFSDTLKISHSVMLSYFAEIFQSLGSRSKQSLIQSLCLNLIHKITEPFQHRDVLIGRLDCFGLMWHKPENMRHQLRIDLTSP